MCDIYLIHTDDPLNSHVPEEVVRVADSAVSVCNILKMWIKRSLLLSIGSNDGIFPCLHIIREHGHEFVGSHPIHVFYLSTRTHQMCNKRCKWSHLVFGCKMTLDCCQLIDDSHFRSFLTECDLMLGWPVATSIEAWITSSWAQQTFVATFSIRFQAQWVKKSIHNAAFVLHWDVWPTVIQIGLIRVSVGSGILRWCLSAEIMVISIFFFMEQIMLHLPLLFLLLFSGFRNIVVRIFGGRVGWRNTLGMVTMVSTIP